MKRQNSSAYLSIVTAMLIFGTIGIVKHYIPDVPSGLLAALRGLVGSLFLVALLYLRGGRLNRAAIKKNLVRLIISGVLIGFNWILLFEAYRYATVATVTLCYYMAPVFVVLLSPLVLKERLTPRKLASVALALVGMIPISGVLERGLGGASEFRGVAFGLGSAALYSCAVLMNQGIKGIGAYDKTIIQLGAAGLSVLPYTLLVEDMSTMPTDGRSLLLVGVVCIVHTGIAYALYFGAMGKVPTQTIALLSYMDPIVAVLLSVLLLQQSLSPIGWVGATLVLGATILSELPLDSRMRLCPARPNQYKKILALYERTIVALKADGIEIYWDLDHHPSREFLRSAMERGELLVAMQGRRILGAMVVDQNQRPEYASVAWLVDAPAEAVAVMHVLAVDPRARGRGVARFMLDELLTLCRARGLSTVRLDALTCNAPACALYRRAGYTMVYAGPIHIPDIGPHDFEIFECPIRA